MTETTGGIPDPQNYILYRTTSWTFQPASYLGSDGKTVTPKPVTQENIGYVISKQLLYGLSGVVAPEGFAYALDADGKYPIGSIYAPPSTVEGAA